MTKSPSDRAPGGTGRPSASIERVLAYPAEQHLVEEPAIAVIIQKMIFSEVSGVMFTADPTSGALDRMIIESVFGQGEAIVSGRVEPDTYILAKAGPPLISVRSR